MTNDASQPPAPEPSARGRHRIGWVRIALLLPAYALMVGGAVFAMRFGVMEAFVMDGPSMEPTLPHGDQLLVDRTAYGFTPPFAHEALLQWGTPRIGDVVIATSPMDDMHVAKRVVAVEGQTVRVDEWMVQIDGRPLETRALGSCASDEKPDCEMLEESFGDRSWRVQRGSLTPAGEAFEATVPPGHVCLLGDNRDQSNDSRNPLFGLVPVERIVGPAIGVYYRPSSGVTWEAIR